MPSNKNNNRLKSGPAADMSIFCRLLLTRGILSPMPKTVISSPQGIILNIRQAMPCAASCRSAAVYARKIL